MTNMLNHGNEGSAEAFSRKLMMGFCAASLSLTCMTVPAFADEADSAGDDLAVQPAATQLGAEAESANPQPVVAGLAIYPKELVILRAGENAQLELDGVYEGKVDWSSTNREVATVDDKGMVTTVGAGSCEIIARVGGKEARCSVLAYALVRDEKGLRYAMPQGGYYIGRASIYGLMYHFGEDGYALTGWQELEGKQYYFEPDSGVMLKDWQQLLHDDEKFWYFFDSENGALQDGWQTHPNLGLMYFDLKKQREPLTGLQRLFRDDVEGIYLFGADGQALTGWQDVEGRKRYFDPKTCVMLKDWQQLPYQNAKAWYHLGEEDGNLQTGWQKNPDAAWMYFNDKDADPRTGWQKLEWKGGKAWYLFDGSNGHMLSGWQKDKGVWYHLAESGRMDTGWLKDKGSWYLLSDSGKMQTGWAKDKGSWYYLSGSGRMQTGWNEVDGSWYYLSDSGKMQTGWVKLEGTWYYLSDSGRMLTGTHTVNGVTQSFASNGAWLG